MGLRRRSDTNRTAPPESPPSAADYLDDIMPFVKKGTVIPILSNSLRIEQIFRADAAPSDVASETADVDEKETTINEELTEVWATDIKYPMMDKHNLARVAQFFQVEEKDVQLAKSKYLKFLNEYLLENEEDENYMDVVSQMRTQEAPFSQIVKKLDYPRFPPGVEDPLRLLARLPLKIYVTTSYYNFMEQALEDEKKTPRTQVVFWSGGKLNSNPKHSPDPESKYEPSVTEPTVYHLFGLEDYPETLVLTEDDFMNFLIAAVVEDTNTQNPVIPMVLRGALAESRLLLLGYRVRDWDFRVLFRFISKFRGSDSAPRSMLIQLKPSAQQSGNKEKSVEYLSQYFEKKQFAVEWTNPEKFIRKLWDKWDKYRKG